MNERRKKQRRKLDREKFNTSIDVKLIELLQDLSYEIGIPMNRLIEDAIRAKYLKEEGKSS
jgi:ribbon-helix-helix protein